MLSYNLSARSRWAAALVAAVAMGLALAGCDVNKALSVDAPSRIPAGTLETPANAALLVNGAVSDFECAYGAYVVVSGLVANGSTWTYQGDTTRSTVEFSDDHHMQTVLHERTHDGVTYKPSMRVTLVKVD